MKKNIKISASAYRVLLLLQKLNEKECDTDEINDFYLEDPHIARIFSKDVIIKYLNTLKASGFDISKPKSSNESCYYLNKSVVSIDFQEEELKTLALLKKCAKSLHQNKFIENYSTFWERIKRYMNEDHLKKIEDYSLLLEKDNEYENFSKFDHCADLIKKIEQYILEKQRVEIKYKSSLDGSEKLDVMELNYIKYEQDDVSIICYNLVSNQINSIKMSNIIDIKQLPDISKVNQLYCPVIFKIKGKLANLYRPYENEKLTERDDKGNVLVTAYSDDVDSLVKRLLRYGENCEVLYPKMLRDRITNLIQAMISNYQS